MLSAEQYASRRHSIHASELAEALGLSRYRGPAEVVASKIYDVAQDSENEATLVGSLLQDSLGSWFAEQTGVSVIPGETSRVGVIAATPDFVIVPDANQGPDLVEAKTHALVGRRDRTGAPVYWAPDDWGEPGTDQVPVEIWVQCHGQLITRPLASCVYVVVWLPSGRRIYVVDRNLEVEGLLEEKARLLWEEYVEQQKLPDASMVSLDLSMLKRIKHTDGKSVETDPKLVRRLKRLRVASNAIKDELEDAEARLRLAIGDATIATAGKEGTAIISKVSRKAYFVAASDYTTITIKDPEPKPRPAPRKRAAK